MFFKHTGEENIVFLIVYVDDIIIIGNDPDETKILKEMLVKDFEIKDFGIPRYFLGIKVARSGKGIFVSQRKYVLDLLQKNRYARMQPGDTTIVLTTTWEQLLKVMQLIDVNTKGWWVS